MKIIQSLLSIVLFQIFNCELNNIRCKDEEGNDVDWLYLYKLPKIKDASSDLELQYIRNGSAYVYMTERNQKWTLSQYSINDTQSIPGVTLDLLYRNVSLEDLGVGYLLYNDQADNIELIKGHTKGLLLFDSVSAIWIVHSFPNYPPKRKTHVYHINSPQLLFGQSMVCITVKFEALELIGQQLLYNYPQIYDYYIPEKLINQKQGILSNLLDVINGIHVSSEPWYSLKTFQTLNKNYEFLSFAKYTLFYDDLYAGLVAQELKSDMRTETWGDGPKTLPSNCSLNYHVYNIQELSFNFINISFSQHHDHSKWAVTVPTVVNLFSKTNSTNIVCLGDINRQIEQYKRAGGTLCLLDNRNVWKQFYNLITNYDKCEFQSQ